jgi:glycosyltransferase involved in cell wall biosynthesis
MKLLIVTQKVDRSDYILGFFHRWLEEFARRVDHLVVIGQSVGDYDKTFHMEVLSLGKEDAYSRLRQIARFWRLIVKHRKDYDAVLVHMTPIWVILGWPLLFVLRKPVSLWYEVRRGSLRLSLALLLVDKVFSATAQGLPRSTPKQIVLGHGIDIGMFSPGDVAREEDRVIAVGRVTRSKRYDVILRAFAELPETFHLSIAGGMVTSADEGEFSRLQELMQELGIADRVAVEWLLPAEMPSLYCRAAMMLHACVGGLDKVVLEAMACGCPVVSTSAAAEGILPPECLAKEGALADHARRILRLSPSERAALSRDLRARVEQHHSLPHLIERLVGAMQ